MGYAKHQKIVRGLIDDEEADHMVNSDDERIAMLSRQLDDALAQYAAAKTGTNERSIAYLDGYCDGIKAALGALEVNSKQKEATHE